MKKITLKPGREKSLLRKHPWVFSGAIGKISGQPGSGETVEICDSSGRFVAWGAYSPESQIRIRVWSWNPDDVIDSNFFRKLLKNAINLRIALFIGSKRSLKNSVIQAAIMESIPIAVRLVNAESDGLPGLIVDRYKDTLVTQFLSAGAEHWRNTFLDQLVDLTKISKVFDRSDADVRRLEGLDNHVGPMVGRYSGKILIEENGLKFVVDIEKGHKTGFYLDQRINRKIVQQISSGKDVLDCFSYSGGFTINALTGGAKTVTAVDSSSQSLELVRENLKINSFSETQVNLIEADVFEQLRKFRDKARQFDLIILDPPKFAPTATHVRRATRAYKDINLLALKLLRAGGILVTFSCSGGVDAALFQKILAGSALDAGVDARIIEHLEQSPDHPVLLSFPESAYLKGLVLRV
ncbi:MAG: class I SAM-dependent rRNA methyltransferase [Anaerolineales bacterium]|jgi:23S rRNA (cytosine1962-C5)-methyltransferase